MSYYIIPKIKNVLNVKPIYSDTESSTPYISISLFEYYNILYEQIQIYLNTPLYEDITKIVNPYEYIFSKVPGSKFSVSKLKPKTNIFYDFLEVSTTLNIFESYKNKNIKTLHITHNNYDSIECFEMIRESYNDKIFYYNKINNNIIKEIENTEIENTEIENNKFDFFYFETDITNSNSYIISLIQYVMIILKNQTYDGSCIIKIDNLFYKPVIDILYFLSSLYDKVYVLKPNSSNVTTFDKYIICKNFQCNENNTSYLKINYCNLLLFLKNMENKYINSIFNFDIPYYFTVKIEEINIIIGQQQIESLDLIINILKNKNYEDKIETIKKLNIQKSVSWCEKYKIPCNKFSEKTNIFLPIIKEYKNILKKNVLSFEEIIDSLENKYNYEEDNI